MKLRIPTASVKFTEKQSEIMTAMTLAQIEVWFEVLRVRFVIEDGKITALEE